MLRIEFIPLITKFIKHFIGFTHCLDSNPQSQGIVCVGLFLDLNPNELKAGAF